MNIAIFAAYYYPHIGGYEKNIHELAKRLVAKEHRVMVVTCNTENWSDREIKDGVLVIRMPSWHLLNKTFPFPKPNMEIFNYYADVVITQTRFFPICLLGMLFAKLKKIPLVHVERGTCHSVVQNKLIDILARTYDHTIGSLIMKSAKVNVGVSKSACYFIEHLKGNNSLVIYNGIECNHDESLRQILNKDLKIIIYVGRLVYAKGVQDLIRSFNICKEKYLGLQLVIVGDGNYRAELEKQALESKYGKDIKFLGQKNIDEVYNLLSISTVFVNPSYSEGLPTSVMEAASFGLPIIATDVGGTREIIEQCKSGFLIQPGNVTRLAEVLDVILGSEKIRSDFGIEAKKAVQKFNWGSITDRWVKVLNSVDKPISAYKEYME